MENNIIDLKEKFERIKNMGWILEKRKGKGAAGYTLEILLEKEEDNFPVPDYHNIEIKTMHKNTKTNLHLFTLTPDGDYLFPIKRIIDELGCPVLDGKKVFYRSFNAISNTGIIYGRFGRIMVNYEKRKVELKVFDNKCNDLDIKISWSFDYLKERISLKLQYLAFVVVSSCIICGKGYYHYDSISFYKLKSFDTFIRLIEDGIIEITFNIGLHQNGTKQGKIYDHGTDFSISIKNIAKLYDEIVI